MNSLSFSPSSSLLLHPPSHSSTHLSFPRLYHRLNCNLSIPKFQSLKCSSLESTIEVVNIEDMLEKDWSFLDIDNLNSLEQQTQKSNRIISAADIKPNSRVLVSIGTEDFIDKLVDESPCQLLLVVHDSIFSLAMIKEKHDDVKCWQGEIIYVPEKWVPFDVVFLTCLPALPFPLTQIFGALAERCAPSAKVIISHPQGRGVVEQQRKEFPDVVTSDLPDKPTLDKVASDYRFDLTEFVDEPGFYLAVLEFSGK
ncbi:hypothetical protein MKW94_006786 [Papaver nudicaule]|uniref:Uncharacterized protein n=1 Tax=Papaver nudicaule TaxID=74823 RepID=A0AA41VAN6_PAPNU|nr:hypothetical protein [Papaver nudicaule]